MNGKRRGQWFCAVSLMGMAVVMAESERLPDEEPSSSSAQTTAATVPATTPGFRKACGGCHFAYPAGLLPPLSWERILTGLGDHFGTNAALPKGELDDVRRYLLNNAGGRGPSQLPYRLLRSLRHDVAPLRITQIPYFVHKHDGLTTAAVRDNPQVRSLSRCEACHTRAEEGRFPEGEVQVPDGRLEN